MEIVHLFSLMEELTKAVVSILELWNNQMVIRTGDIYDRTQVYGLLWHQEEMAEKNPWFPARGLAQLPPLDKSLIIINQQERYAAVTTLIGNLHWCQVQTQRKQKPSWQRIYFHTLAVCLSVLMYRKAHFPTRIQKFHTGWQPCYWPTHLPSPFLPANLQGITKPHSPHPAYTGGRFGFFFEHV